MRQDVILEKIEKFRDRIRRLYLMNFDREKIIRFGVDQSAFERNVQVLVEQIVGIAVSIVKEYDLGYLSSPSDSIDVLFQENVISEDVHTTLRKAWGMRNILVHEYSSIDYQRLAELWPDEIKKLAIFIEEVIEYLEKRNE